MGRAGLACGRSLDTLLPEKLAKDFRQGASCLWERGLSGCVEDGLWEREWSGEGHRSHPRERRWWPQWGGGQGDAERQVDSREIWKVNSRGLGEAVSGVRE